MNYTKEYTDHIKRELANQVKKQIAKRGCSITSLANFANVHPEVVNRIIQEKNVTIDSITKICYMLEIKINIISV